MVAVENYNNFKLLTNGDGSWIDAKKQKMKPRTMTQTIHKATCNWVLIIPNFKVEIHPKSFLVNNSSNSQTRRTKHDVSLKMFHNLTSLN